jgi:hypothetical protein
VVSVIVMLSGCGVSGSKGRIRAGINLPQLPDYLSRTCKYPTIKIGVGAKLLLAKHRAALGVCRRRHITTVKFYREIRKGFSIK